MGKRLDRSWRGTATQHTARLTSISPGSDHDLIVPWGVLKTNPTAVPSERPPGRQTITLIMATLRTAVTEPLTNPDCRTCATRGSDKQNLSAREPPQRTNRDDNATTNAGERDCGRTIFIIDTAVPPIAPIAQPIHVHNNLHRCLKTNRCQSKPLCAPLTHSKREHALTDQPREEPINSTEKVTPPHPIEQQMQSPRHIPSAGLALRVGQTNKSSVPGNRPKDPTGTIPQQQVRTRGTCGRQHWGG